MTALLVGQSTTTSRLHRYQSGWTTGQPRSTEYCTLCPRGLGCRYRGSGGSLPTRRPTQRPRILFSISLLKNSGIPSAETLAMPCSSDSWLSNGDLSRSSLHLRWLQAVGGHCGCRTFPHPPLLGGTSRTLRCSRATRPATDDPHHRSPHRTDTPLS